MQMLNLEGNTEQGRYLRRVGRWIDIRTALYDFIPFTSYGTLARRQERVRDMFAGQEHERSDGQAAGTEVD